jgi:MFS family permease
MLFGGTLADRFGYKTCILLGLTLRATGFASLGLATTFPTVLGAAIVSGLGGAVFSPASRAYISVSAPQRRAEIFALENAFSQAGALLGPLVGLALLGISLETVALTSAAVFFCLMVFQSRFLPVVHSPSGGASMSILAGWAEVLRNRPFVLFAIAMFGQFTLINQLYLGLPLEIERLTGSETGISGLFIVSSIVTILLQVQVTSFFKKRIRTAYAIVIGLCIMGLAFVPSLLSAVLLDGTTDEIDLLSSDGLVLLLPLLSAGLLAVGVMVANPFALEMVPKLGKAHLTATYFGVYQTASGFGALAGNSLTGVAFDQQERLGVEGLPWLFMVALGFFCAAFMFTLSRRPEFQDRPAREPEAAATTA